MKWPVLLAAGVVVIGGATLTVNELVTNDSTPEDTPTAQATRQPGPTVHDLNREPSSPVGRSGTDARACRAHDVHAELGDQDGALGHLLITIRFRNVSNSSCVLKGYPGAVASDPGRPDVRATKGSYFPSPGTANMPPGGITLLGLETDTECAARPDGAGGIPPYHVVTIRLPGRGDVRVESRRSGFDVTCGLKLTKFYAGR